MARKQISAAEAIAKKIRALSNEPNVERILLIIPENSPEFPSGEYILGPFLRIIAAALEGKL